MVLWWWSVWAGTLVVDGARWILTLDAYDEECFLLRTPTTHSSRRRNPPQLVLTGDYGLIDDVSADPLLLYVTQGSDERVVYQTRGRPSDTFRLPVQLKEQYWLCIQNSSHGPEDHHLEEPEHEDGRTRRVGLAYRLEYDHNQHDNDDDDDNNNNHHRLPQEVQSHADEWRTQSGDIHDQFRNLQSHHEYLKVRESNHRALAEHNFSAVLIWTLAEAGVVLTVACAQILYLRRFLERQNSRMY